MGAGVGQVPSVLALHRRRALQVSPLQRICRHVIKMFRSPLLAGRVHGWLASRAASAWAILQHMHVVLPANTAANDLHTTTAE